MIRFPPRRILVAVDFSRPALHAWRAAKEIAERFRAALEVVWVIEPPAAGVEGLPSPGYPPGYRERGRALLRRRLGPGAKIHAIDGFPAGVIRRLAKNRGCDLIVIGVNRRSPLVRLLQGSTAEEVVHAAPCPVLVVPRQWRLPRLIVAPVCDNAYARRGALAAAVVARAYRGRLTLLQVVAKPADLPRARERLLVQAQAMPAALRRDVRAGVEARAGATVREILRAGRRHDLTVLLAHRKSLLGDMVLGTTVERVLRHARTPVLAMPSS